MRWLSAALVLVALVAAARVATVREVDHDGSVSFLAATGHQEAYGQGAPSGRWVPAQQWQAFWKLDRATAARPATLARIGRELGRTDIHPPLYFWVLHLWFAVAGATPRAAAALGVLWLLVAVVLVDRLARRSGAAPAVAAGAAALWGLSGATLTAIVEPRPYGLVAVLSVGLVLAVDAAVRTPSARRWLGLVAVGGAGLLVQYHMAVLGAAVGLVAAVRLVRDRNWRRVRALAGAGVAALGLATLAHPFLATALDQRGTGAGGGIAVAERIGLSAAAVVRMLLPAGGAELPSRTALAGMAVAGVVLVAGFVVALWRSRRTVPLALASGVSAFALMAALFVAGATPAHSMGPRYTTLVSGLLAAGLAGWLSRSSARGTESVRRGLRVAVAGFVVAGFVVAGVMAPPRLVDRFRPLPTGIPLVIDASQGGLVMPLVRPLPAQRLVWAGTEPPAAVPADRILVVTTSAGSPTRHTAHLRRLGFREDGDAWNVAGGTARVWTRRPTTRAPLLNSRDATIAASRHRMTHRVNTHRP